MLSSCWVCAVLVSSFRRACVLEQWSFVNAVGMLAATMAGGLLGRMWPLLLAGGGLLAGLVGAAWGRWTPQGRFGRANVVTGLRAILLGGLPMATAHPAAVLGLGVLFLAADALDGWLARRDGTASAFGAFFDKEADALFVLLLCMGAVLQGQAPAWIVGAGLLRYLFVVAVFLLDPPEKTEARSQWARYAYGATVGTLLLVFLPYPAVVRPVLYFAAAALAVSFGRSFWQIVPRRQPFRNG